MRVTVNHAETEEIGSTGLSQLLENPTCVPAPHVAVSVGDFVRRYQGAAGEVIFIEASLVKSARTSASVAWSTAPLSTSLMVQIQL